MHIMLQVFSLVYTRYQYFFFFLVARVYFFFFFFRTYDLFFLLFFPSHYYCNVIIMQDLRPSCICSVLLILIVVSQIRGQHRRPLCMPLLARTVRAFIAFLSREGFSPLFPRRLASNCVLGTSFFPLPIY